MRQKTTKLECEIKECNKAIDRLIASRDMWKDKLRAKTRAYSDALRFIVFVKKSRDMWKEKARMANKASKTGRRRSTKALLNRLNEWKSKAEDRKNELAEAKRIVRSLYEANDKLTSEIALRGASLERIRRLLEMQKVPSITLLYDIIDDYTLRCGGKKWSETYNRQKYVEKGERKAVAC